MNVNTDPMTAKITTALEKTHKIGLKYGRREGFVVGVITGCVISAAAILIVATFS